MPPRVIGPSQEFPGLYDVDRGDGMILQLSEGEARAFDLNFGQGAPQQAALAYPQGGMPAAPQQPMLANAGAPALPPGQASDVPFSIVLPDSSDVTGGRAVGRMDHAAQARRRQAQGAEAGGGDFATRLGTAQAAAGGPTMDTSIALGPDGQRIGTVTDGRLTLDPAPAGQEGAAAPAAQGPVRAASPIQAQLGAMLIQSLEPRGGGRGGPRQVSTETFSASRPALERLSPEEQQAYMRAQQQLAEAQQLGDEATMRGAEATIAGLKNRARMFGDAGRQMSEMDARNAQREQARQEYMRRAQEQLGEMARRTADMTVDPGRIFASRTRGQRIGAGIGMILGGIGRSILSGGDPNAIAADPVLQAMYEAMDRDIEAQRANINQANAALQQGRGLFADAMAAFGDERVAEAAAKDAMLARLEAQLKEAGEQAASEIERQRVAAALAGVAQERAAAQAAALEGAAGTFETQVETTQRAGGGGGRRGPSTQDVVRAIGGLEQLGLVGGEGEEGDPGTLAERKELEDRIRFADETIADVDRALVALEGTFATGGFASLGLDAVERVFNENARVLQRVLDRAAILRQREMSGAQMTNSEREYIRAAEGLLTTTRADEIESELRRLRDLAVNNRESAYRLSRGSVVAGRDARSPGAAARSILEAGTSTDNNPTFTPSLTGGR